MPILALPDTSRFAYIALGGEHCEIHNICVDTAPEETDPESIPRIAEEISFIKDQPRDGSPDTFHKSCEPGQKRYCKAAG